MESVDNQDFVTIDRQPKLADPMEVNIRRRLEEELLSTPWARSLFDQMRDLQVEFFKFALTSLNTAEQIKDRYIKLLDQLSTDSRAKIVKGQEALDQLNPQKAVIVITNHLGTAKLTSFPPSDINLRLPIDTIEPFPIRHAAISIIARQLGRSVSESAIQLPNSLKQVQEATGVILVAAGGTGRLTQLETNTRLKTINDTNILIIMYPEGGTSGKRNNGGPYDLDEFQTGAFVVAAHLDVPVLPICQYFNPESGFELGVLPLIQPEQTDDREYFKQLAQSTQTSMQQWLNSRK